MGGAKSKILSLFKKNIGKSLSKEKIARIAGIFDWARVVRLLRQEGYPIELLADGSYVMKSGDKKDSGKNRIAIDAKTRYRILQRDNSICQRCGRAAADKIKLVIDHKIPVEMGGDTSDENLWVLCEECNLGKKHWLSDENAHEMKKILSEKGAEKRLSLYFDLHPNEFIEISKLQLIGGTREWTRSLRSIREKQKRGIVYVRKDEKTGKEGYVYKK